MKKISTLMAIIFAVSLWSCKDSNQTHDHGDGAHSHDEPHEHGLEPVSYTIWTDKSELFVEFKPLVIGQESRFAAHFTNISNFKAIEEGKATVSLIKGEKGIRHTADSPSSPGIFRLALTPKEKGIYTLVFDIQTKDFTDKIVIDSIPVFENEEIAANTLFTEEIGDEISYLKEQAWKIDFANQEVKEQPFASVIKATGKILPAQGSEMVISAKSNGVFTFSNRDIAIGSKVKKDQAVFTINSKGITENNLQNKFKEASNNLEKAKSDYERGEKLVAEKIISEKEFQELKRVYDNAKNDYQTLASDYSVNGQKVKSPLAGFIKDIHVEEGQYVTVGQPIATITQNERLKLAIDVPQKYYASLSTINAVNFSTSYSDKVFKSSELNGKMKSYGKSTGESGVYVPVQFEIDNKGELIPGSFIEVYLLSNAIQNALTIPKSALMEEQGKYYAYVQTSGEGFQKRELTLGDNDGEQFIVLSGIAKGERVVTQGSQNIKLSSMSGKMPAHGHEH